MSFQLGLSECLQYFKLLLRLKFDKQGRAIGFYAGGASHRGMSLRNTQRLHRKALMLGGMSNREAKTYSFHGARRADVTFAENFGEAADGEAVAIQLSALKLCH